MSESFVAFGRFEEGNDPAVKTFLYSGSEHEISGLTGDTAQWNQVLALCDGTKTLDEVCALNGALPSQEVGDFLNSLAENNLAYRVDSGERYMTGDEAILVIEDLQAELLHKTLYANKFWRALQTPKQVPVNVYYGMAIENFNFLYRESWFDSPVLNYVASEKARLKMNEFYGEEYGHDELIFKALSTLGITQQQIRASVPLPETLALCNALAYWAATDPLFFFTTMGILEGKDIEVDSYILAMQASGKVDKAFIDPILAHANINIGAEHGVLTRELFAEIPVVTADQLRSMKANTHVFVELYDNFHSAVWDFYSTTDTLLRPVNP
ncbi:iron-containing redox enzyme family protein [Pseudomonas anuradhapurensis]|uniref:iron-containing redox enzyme family protein n=1 Tax=Pseudomonas anuradhapurensis TaxID=485870 RepID=UPI0016457AC2|nr:iron-containing redox enzyme family protein [Pseudomonas anuradhapurensis]QXI48522.1 iron-containing redox enzyme family protein [Pseudomonas anuradhapurensis]